MTRPGFRKGRSSGGSGGTPGAPRNTDGGDGFLSSSLFSQAQILHLMKNEFARARRHGIPLGCVLMQVDRLPQLVDLHGAALRQAVRQAVASLVRERTRGADLLGATNDDRYLLLLPHTDIHQTRTVATRLHALFAELAIASEGRELVLTLSVGFTATGAQPAMFFDTLVGQAEAALEAAFERGGNCVLSYGELAIDGDADPAATVEPADHRAVAEDAASGGGAGSGSGAADEGGGAERRHTKP